jgi:hypothetical protein
MAVEVKTPKTLSPADRIRIDITDDYELTYFSRAFGVTPDQLRSAVAKVGPVVHAVRDELKSVAVDAD